MEKGTQMNWGIAPMCELLVANLASMVNQLYATDFLPAWSQDLISLGWVLKESQNQRL